MAEKARDKKLGQGGPQGVLAFVCAFAAAVFSAWLGYLLGACVGTVYTARLCATVAPLVAFPIFFGLVFSRLRDRRFSESIGNALIYMILTAYLLAVVLPLLWVVFTSFKNSEQIFKAPYAAPSSFSEAVSTGSQNYQSAWVKSHFKDYLFNSVKVVSLSLLLILAASVPAAYILGRFRFKGVRALLVYFLSGMMVPGALLIIPLFFQVTAIGQAVTAAMGIAGFDARSYKFELHDTHTCLVLLYASGCIPFSIFILTGFFRTIPSALYEAAIADGASEFQAFFHVMLPLARSGIIAVAIFNFLELWNEYMMALVFLNSESLKTIPLGLAGVSIMANYKTDFGLLFASLVIAMLPSLAVYVVLQKRLVRGITLGAVKG